MDTVLLRAWRFLVDFQYRWVLKQPAHTLDRGPAVLAPLLDHVPALFVLMEALRCRVSVAPAGDPPPVWVGRVSPRIDAALQSLAGELELPLATIVLRRRPALAVLPSPALLVRIVRLVSRRAGGLDRHVQLSLVEMLLEYAALGRRFARRPPKLVVIPCDLSPRRIAAGAAAERHGVPSLYLQLSLFNTYVPPFRPSRAMVINPPAERALAAAGLPTVRRVLRSRRPALREPADPPRDVGIVLNAFVDPGALPRRLAAIRKRFPETRFRVRRHPRSRLRIDPLPDGFTLDPPQRPLADFARDIELALAGNSVAQLDLLGLGVPVVHLDGLDGIAFDHCGFVAEGLVFGVRSPEDIMLDRVRSFYARPEWSAKLAERLGLFPDDAGRERERRAFRNWLVHQLGPAISGATGPCAAS